MSFIFVALGWMILLATGRVIQKVDPMPGSRTAMVLLSIDIAACAMIVTACALIVVSWLLE